jgi:heat shock protein beta
MDDVEVEDYKRKEGGPEKPQETKPAEDVEVKETSEDSESDGEKQPPEEPKKKTITETIWDWELINDVKAIWLRPKNEIEEKEYSGFYKSITKDNEDPLTYTHFTAEGDIEFKSILFIPTHSSHDLFENYYGSNGQMKLYVRKVLISDSFEDLMPRYLNFISGVVHSDDLPLNVSREQLQQLKMIKVMSKKLI